MNNDTFVSAAAERSQQVSDMYDAYRKDGYSYGAAINDLCNRNFNSRAVGIAMEASQNAEGYGDRDNFAVPMDALVPDSFRAKRSFFTDASPGGQNFVPTTLSTSLFTDYLRDRLVLFNLGATVLTGLVGKLDISGFTTDISSGWLPNQASTITTNDPDSGKMTLEEKRVGAYTTISNRVSNTSPLNLESILREKMVNKLDRDLQASLLTSNATGTLAKSTITNTSNAPGNLFKYAGAKVVVQGAANTLKAVGYADLFNMVNEIGAENAIINPNSVCFVMPYIGKTKFASLTGSDGHPLMNVSSVMGEVIPYLAGERLFVTNAISSKYAKGTANNGFDVACMDASQLILGLFGNAMNVAIGTSGSEFQNDQYGIRTTMAVDAAPLYQKSFVLYRAFDGN